MLPEAIAIVCAPKHSPRYVRRTGHWFDHLSKRLCSFGVFRLTDPPGMGIISECRAEGAFHPHADMPIYTVSLILVFSQNERNSAADI